MDYDVLGEALRSGDTSVLSGASLATLHVALQVDALAPEHVPVVGRVVLAQLGAPARGAPLSLRLRLLHACRALAVSARTTADGVREDDIESVVQVLDVLVRDRDPAVATPAAAAMGALAKRSPRAAAALAGASTAAGERRVIAASVVQWVLGDRTEASLERVLSGVDNFGVAEAIRALSAWRISAPLTIDAAVLALAETGAPAEVHIAATGYALAIAETTARRSLLDALRSTARPTEPGFALWSGKRAERAWALLESARELRWSVRGGIADGAAAVTRTFDAINEAIAWIDDVETGAGVDAMEEALDLTFVASSLVSDVLLATSTTDEEGAARWRAWAKAMLRLRAHRIAALQRAGRDRVEVREAARRLGRALDATPKSIQREVKDHASPAAVLRDAHERLTKNKERLLDRSLARLFALAIEVMPSGMPPVDALALMLSFPRKVLRHFASTFALEGLEYVALAIVALGDVVDEARKATSASAPTRRVRRKLAESLAARLRELETSISALADGPLSRGLDYLVRSTISLLHEERLSEAIDAVLERGIDGVTRAVHDALGRYEMTRSAAAGTLASSKRLRQLLMREGEEPSQRGDGRGAEPSRLLPIAFEGLLETVLVLEGALDPESRGPAPGTIVGDYVVVKMLGSGGMGACVLAKPRSARAAPQVVIKLPRRTTGMHRTFFRKEALALLQLAEFPHPGIVRFVAFNDGGATSPHLVMEYVEGISLEKRIATSPLPFDEGLAVFASLTRAVAHAHAHHIGHYDVKPANVMLSKKHGGTPVLVDWGISGGSFRANTGTPEYMSPERYAAHGDGEAALSSDVYALACLFVEIVSKEVLLGAPVTAADERVTPGIMELYERMGEGAYRRMLVAQLIATDRKMRRGRIERLLAGAGAPPWVVELVSEMLDEDPLLRPAAATVVERLAAQLELAGDCARSSASAGRASARG